MKYVEDPFQGAAVYVEDGYIREIIEKPARGTSTTNWNSAGIYCFRASVFDGDRPGAAFARGEYEITSAIEQMIVGGKKLRAVEIQGSVARCGAAGGSGGRYGRDVGLLTSVIPYYHRHYNILLDFVATKSQSYLVQKSLTAPKHPSCSPCFV